jgi:hypothetical protein
MGMGPSWICQPDEEWKVIDFQMRQAQHQAYRSAGQAGKLLDIGDGPE